jgi:hypothetical protein
MESRTVNGFRSDSAFSPAALGYFGGISLPRPAPEADSRRTRTRGIFNAFLQLKHLASSSRSFQWCADDLILSGKGFILSKLFCFAYRSERAGADTYGVLYFF